MLETTVQANRQNVHHQTRYYLEKLLDISHELEKEEETSPYLGWLYIQVVQQLPSEQRMFGLIEIAPEAKMNACVRSDTCYRWSLRSTLCHQCVNVFKQKTSRNFVKL